MPIFKVIINGEEKEIEVTRQRDRLSVTFDGETRNLLLLHNSGSRFLLERVSVDGTRQRIRGVGHLDGSQRQLWVNGRAFTYQRARRHSAVVDEPANDLSATIPSVVSEILVKVGDTVSSGDKLILLESMKMIIPIQASVNGTISRINCTVGEAVQPGVQLIEMA